MAKPSENQINIMVFHRFKGSHFSLLGAFGSPFRGHLEIISKILGPFGRQKFETEDPGNGLEF